MTETRKIAAILAADIVGFGRMASANEDRTLARIRALRADVIDPIIASQNGRIFKRTGDGALVEFRSVVEAVRSAVSVQNAMAERNFGMPEDQQIVFRIGIHLGDVVEEADGDLMGAGVNIAARLEGIAPPGAICLSEDAYRQVKGRIDLKATDLGPTRLKNIADPVRAYTLNVEIAAPPKQSQRRRLAAPLTVALSALLVVVAGGAWWFSGANRPEIIAKAPAEAAPFSIVVLPFANVSGDPAQDYLVDALTDEVTTALARQGFPFVIARNTAMTFKGKAIDVKTIGKELRVRYVLEGSVQPSGDRMRVTAQLIDSASGAHLWADQFDSPRSELLQTQDLIVTRLANAINYQFMWDEERRIKRAAAPNPTAEELALQCNAGVAKARIIDKGADAAFALCEQALAIDPNNVRALDLLGVRLVYSVSYGFSADPKGDLDRADQLASKELALDPDFPSAHELKGGVLLAQRRAEESLVEYERALALDPSAVSAAGALGFGYQRLGEFDKSIEYFDRAIVTSPRDPEVAYWYGGKATDDFGLKHYEKAIDLARQSIAINPNVPWVHTSLMAALALTGRDVEAREALQRYLTIPSTARLRSIAALKDFRISLGGDPRFVEMSQRQRDGLRKAGMPEE